MLIEKYLLIQSESCFCPMTIQFDKAKVYDNGVISLKLNGKEAHTILSLNNDYKMKNKQSGKYGEIRTIFFELRKGA